MRDTSGIITLCHYAKRIMAQHAAYRPNAVPFFGVPYCLLCGTFIVFKNTSAVFTEEKDGEEMATALKQDTPVLWEIPSAQETIYVEQLPALRSQPVYEALKRSFDICISFLALVILMIPMAILSLVIMIDSPGSPIYSQVRLGKGEKPFRIYKFRSMRIDAEEDGLRWAEDHVPRTTKVGRFLRRTRIDELPQLWNILIGDMSFVGPRPERPEFYEIFDTYIIGFRQRMLVKPGLTGLAQVSGGYELKPEEKIVYDLDYIRSRSIGLDVICILKTIMLVFTHRGAR